MTTKVWVGEPLPLVGTTKHTLAGWGPGEGLVFLGTIPMADGTTAILLLLDKPGRRKTVLYNLGRTFPAQIQLFDMVIAHKVTVTQNGNCLELG